jgi:HPt (histidine-containing phosphotransfer) domain-containing protein
MSNNNRLIQLDINLLDGYAQSLGSHIVKQMFALYEQQVVIYLKDIEDSLCCDDIQLWQECCHKMKGAAGSVGLKALHRRLKKMENTNASKDDKAQQLVDLNAHNKQAMAEFTHWLASL